MTLKGIAPDYSKLPEHIQGAVQRYIEQGIPPGSFLEAIICNDLKTAIGRADHINEHCIKDIVMFFYWEVPGLCWGSRLDFDEWVKQGGLQGKEGVVSS